ncbi:MAG: hypothetical protein Q4C17_07555 [Bacillota bacterium]|nr:hypothetical protein [Bacillota bacterium]
MANAKRNYKDNTFCALFSEKRNLIELYNALSGSSFDMDTPVEIVTLDNTFFGDRENDLSFIIDNRWIVLAEQQSTLSPNIPLRMLVYVARQYENLVFSRDIYSRKLVKIPTPELYVFYNGPQDAPVEQEMKLSDAFMAECDRIALEVAVKFINVNYEKGAEILKRCKAMEGYSLLLHMIREECEATGELKTAIEKCIRKCVEEGIIADFLKEHGGEVMSFLFEKLTREECEAIREADGFEEGYAKGIEKGEASGFAKGKTEGYEEGEAAGELKVARAMKAKGMTTNEICEITGLKPEQVEEL